ncbi:STIMATE family protein ASCRUDRAFT_21836, partial [Ascoidea rubescens DSM 1968]
QSFMGLSALSVLIYKRYREYPNRRPWKIWFFDVSKQVIGGIFIHFLNLSLSFLKNGVIPNHYLYSGVDGNSISGETNGNDDNNDNGNPCNWYFLNILFDTTIGVPILWLLIYIIFEGGKRAQISGISSGEYGNPPSFWSYLKQLVLYVVALISMKLIVYILLISVPIFEEIADWLLSRFDNVPNLQIFIVTFLTPLLMNCFQYFCIDNIIQSSQY